MQQHYDCGTSSYALSYSLTFLFPFCRLIVSYFQLFLSFLTALRVVLGKLLRQEISICGNPLKVSRL